MFIGKDAIKRPNGARELQAVTPRDGHSFNAKYITPSSCPASSLSINCYCLVVHVEIEVVVPYGVLRRCM
jgi:hypothetical protein